MGFQVQLDSIDIEVECSECGADLEVSYNSSRGILKVDQCDFCFGKKNEAIKKLEDELQNRD